MLIFKISNLKITQNRQSCYKLERQITWVSNPYEKSSAVTHSYWYQYKKVIKKTRLVAKSHKQAHSLIQKNASTKALKVCSHWAVHDQLLRLIHMMRQRVWTLLSISNTTIEKKYNIKSPPPEDWVGCTSYDNAYNLFLKFKQKKC